MNLALYMDLTSHIGDHVPDCRLLFFTVPDLAGNPRTSKPTTGLSLASVGPTSFAATAASSFGKTALSHSSTAADTFAIEFALRVSVLQRWTSKLRLRRCAPLTGGF